MKRLTIKAYLVLFTLLMIATSQALATSCVDQGSFLQYLSAFSRSTTPIRIVRATVKRYGLGPALNRGFGYTSVTVEVDKVIKGPVSHGELTLTGNTHGMSIAKTITVEEYPIGSEHLFLLSADSKTQGLLGCGESSIQINGTNAEGATGYGYRRKPYTLDLEDLIRQIEAF